MLKIRLFARIEIPVAIFLDHSAVVVLRTERIDVGNSIFIRVHRDGAEMVRGIHRDIIDVSDLLFPVAHAHDAQLNRRRPVPVMDIISGRVLYHAGIRIELARFIIGSRIPIESQRGSR